MKRSLQVLFGAYFICSIGLAQTPGTMVAKGDAPKPATVTVKATPAVQTPKPAIKKTVPVVKKKIDDYSFYFRYYQVYKNKGAFDSTQKWTGSKLIKTFENKGNIYYNYSKQYLSWKLIGEKEKDVLFIFARISKDHLEMISGVKYYRFKDEELGPSVAIYHPDKNIWIIYRNSALPKH